MSLINWRKKGESPFLSSFVENFFRDDDNFFKGWPERVQTPAVNVVENDKSYSLEVAVPGMKKEDFKIEVDKGVLTISSESKSEKEESDDNYTRKEFSYSSFSRSFWLPENTTEDIKAEYKDGLLKVIIPKTKVTTESTGKTIEIS